MLHYNVMIEYISHSSIALWIHYKIWFLIYPVWAEALDMGNSFMAPAINRIFSCKFFPVLRWGIFKVRCRRTKILKIRYVGFVGIRIHALSLYSSSFDFLHIRRHLLPWPQSVGQNGLQTGCYRIRIYLIFAFALCLISYYTSVETSCLGPSPLVNSDWNDFARAAIRSK